MCTGSVWLKHSIAPLVPLFPLKLANTAGTPSLSTEGTAEVSLYLHIVLASCLPQQVYQKSMIARIDSSWRVLSIAHPYRFMSYTHHIDLSRFNCIYEANCSSMVWRMIFSSGGKFGSIFSSKAICTGDSILLVGWYQSAILKPPPCRPLTASIG